MESIRGRLTIWYATALILSIGVFAVVLYFARRSATYQDLDRRIQSEADLTAGILAESFRARGVLVQKDTAARPVLIPEVAAVLEVVPDYLLVTSKDGSLLFGSPDARSLGFARVAQGPAPSHHHRCCLCFSRGLRAGGPRRPGDGGPRARAGGQHDHRDPRNHRRPQPASPARHSHGEGRAGPSRRDAQPEVDASRAQLRRAAALHGRREPRAQDTADRRPRGGGARDHAARPAARDARPARGDAPGGEPDDGAARRAVDAGTRGRGTRGTAQGAGRLAGDH